MDQQFWDSLYTPKKLPLKKVIKKASNLKHTNDQKLGITRVHVTTVLKKKTLVTSLVKIHNYSQESYMHAYISSLVRTRREKKLCVE